MTNRFEINTALVERLIALQFPEWATHTIKPVVLSGWDNRTFHLGETMTVRLPSAVGYSPQALKEQHWLPILAPHLSLPIPTLLGKGEPNDLFPWKWGIYRWIDGEPTNRVLVENLADFAKSLANFLRELQQIDATEGPLAGAHCCFRGASLLTYNDDTEQAIEALKHLIDADLAKAIWADATASEWNKPPVWFHGDIAPGNLIVKDGQLTAVIDFGCCGVGDPACDLAIAWTFLFGENRKIFRTELDCDNQTWSRGRGWALWKALITINSNEEAKRNDAFNTLKEIFDDFKQFV